jgi:serine/threonine protein kinase
MGAVYVAEQLSTGKQRALKLMHAELAWDARLRERFVQEARVGASIDSDHVVEVVGAGVDSVTGMPWLAMELLEGLDLAAYVQQRGPLAFEEVREILSQLCHALAAAHRVGIVHRDLKPQNIFIARSRQQNMTFKVKVLDFGIAKVVAAARHTSAATAVVGTPLWMAPEQTDSQAAVSPASDVWALGLIAFRMLTARWYWMQAAGDSSSVMMLMREVLFEPIVPPSIRAAQMGLAHLIPQGFDAWFQRCVDRNPQARFRDAAEAAQALMAVPGSHAPGSQPLPNSYYLSTNVPSAALPPASLVGASTAVSPYSTASPQDASYFSQLPVQPAPTKRRSFLWIWMVLGIFVVLLAAAGIVLFLGAAAVGIDASANDENNSQNMAGSYVIAQGLNPGGQGRYAGSATIQQLDSTSYRIRWDLTVGAPVEGVGLVSGRVFGVGYGSTPDYTVAVYEIDAGTLRGIYTRPDMRGQVRREVLVGPAGLVGVYQVKQSEQGAGGQVEIRPNGATFFLSRNYGTGVVQGTGIKMNDRLVVTWAKPEGKGGVVAYQIGSGSLEGRWALLTSSLAGTEVLRKNKLGMETVLGTPSSRF